MTFTYADGVLITGPADARPCDAIVDSTVNTWQKDRGRDETARDTAQGKAAEEVMKRVFREFSGSLSYVTYDEIRDDCGKKHAPFDGLIMRAETEEDVSRRCADRIFRDVSADDAGRITPDTRKRLRACGIYTVEIKSSRVSDGMRRRAEADADGPASPTALARVLAEQDIWIYPRFCRKDGGIGSYDDYARFVYDAYPACRGKDADGKPVGFETFRDRRLPALESAVASDVCVRVFAEYGGGGIERFYVCGYALSTDVILNRTITRFPSEKSRDVLYMTLPIRKAKSVLMLPCDGRLWRAR